jgi:hypothetical protein
MGPNTKLVLLLLFVLIVGAVAFVVAMLASMGAL